MNQALKIFGTLSIATTVAACGATSNGSGTGNPTPTPTPGQGATIANIQQGNVTPGSEVTLESVIVTAIRPGNNGVDFFAQDAGGGAYSGIYFFDQDGLAPAELAIGDEINVVGTFLEFESGTTGGTISEIKPSSIEIVNTGLTPTIDSIPAASIATELADAAGAEKWEGCLIEIDGSVNVSNTALGFGEYLVANGSATFRVDDMIVDTLASRFANEQLTYVAGVWHYSFDNYKLLPRTQADVVGSTPPPAVVATIASIQDPATAPAEGAMVSVENAVVVGAFTVGTGTAAKRRFWIQQGPAGARNGVFVFQQSGTLANVNVGDTINLTAKFTEYRDSGTMAPNSLTELVLDQNGTVTVVSTGATPAVHALTLADLMVDPELYEGTLVQLTDASLAVDNPDLGFGEFSVKDANATLFIVDDLAFPDAEIGVQATDTFSIVRGVFHYSFGNYKIEPRDASDLVKQ